ncbi:ribosomal maturation YjgA family protein [Catellatospora bangladeshensis]|uniref:DUF2809 domain-containing protein n=1 Tax=Catellatospora bangladeshensis TaxID=310355 RepID=A0A8J3JU75_9ACTN|nr:DUF2809 domain-containing protein [Catellatospora bangladeshensis]GIF85245.1 hypothetical protein Cba03nite_65940 [Catellatospora bangladeshensis]
MPLSTRTTRVIALASAAVILAIALALRAAFDGPVEQHSGTALYASMVYAGGYVLWPRLSPLAAGAVAVAFCWLVECSQLTGVPAYLSGRSLLGRLALGVQFDPLDLLWYPVGVLPLAAAHWLLRRRAYPRSAVSGKVQA